MRITVSRSTDRTTTHLMRSLDDDERRLIISTPWDQPDAKTIGLIWNQLTEEEQRVVAAASTCPLRSHPMRSRDEPSDMHGATPGQPARRRCPAHARRRHHRGHLL